MSEQLHDDFEELPPINDLATPEIQTNEQVDIPNLTTTRERIIQHNLNPALRDTPNRQFTREQMETFFQNIRNRA